MLQLRATDPNRLGVTRVGSLAGARTGDWTSVTVSVDTGGAGTAARGSLPVLNSSIQLVSILYYVHLYIQHTHNSYVSLPQRIRRGHWRFAQALLLVGLGTESELRRGARVAV